MQSHREIAISILAVASIFVILLTEFLAVSDEVAVLIYLVDAVIVAILSADFYIRAKRSDGPARYVLKNWYELLALIPAFLFAFLVSEPILGATLRSLRVIRIFRLAVLLPRVIRAFNFVATLLVESKLLYLMIVSAITVTVGAFTIYALEADLIDSKITTFSDAMWWALATVTTVGYGDVVPVTTEGRIVGVVLMVAGIAIFGIFISSVGAILVETRLRRRSKEGVASDVKELVKAKIDSLEELSPEELDLLLALIRELYSVRKRDEHNSRLADGK